MITPELKPCPFCGGKPKSSKGNSTYGRFWHVVWCDNCQFEMRDQEVWDKTRPGMLDPAYPAAECLTRWNRRADLCGPMTDPRALALVEALKDAMAGLEYVRYHYGELHGVGFMRVRDAGDAALAAMKGETE